MKKTFLPTLALSVLLSGVFCTCFVIHANHKARKAISGPLIDAFPIPARDYQIECNNEGMILYDGRDSIGFVRWEEKETALEKLIFNDNQ